MSQAGGDDIIVRLGRLQHYPHRFHVVARITPVAARFEVAQKQLLLETELDAAECAGDLTRYEGLAAAFRFVIEKDAIAHEQSISFAIIDGVPMRCHLTGGIGAARIKWRGFALRRMSGSKHFRRAGLIQTYLPASVGRIIPECFEQT